MISFGRLSHLSDAQKQIVLSTNRDLVQSKSGRFKIPKHRVFLTTLNLADSWLPGLLNPGPHTIRDLLRPKIFGCCVSPNVWYCPFSKKLRKKPTMLRGGVVTRLRKLEALPKAKTVVLTTPERVDRVARCFARSQIYTFNKINTFKTEHLVVDEAFRVKSKSDLKLISAFDAKYRWLVNPYVVNEKCLSMLNLNLGGALKAADVAVAVGSSNTFCSLDKGRCCICFEQQNRLTDVCANRHKCCLKCCKRLRGRCMVCRGKTLSWL
jgi:hypothetical protein